MAADEGQHIRDSDTVGLSRPWPLPFLLGVLIGSISLAASWAMRLVVGPRGSAIYAVFIGGVLIAWGVGSALSRVSGLRDLTYWPIALGTGLPLLGFVGLAYIGVTWFGWREPAPMELVFYPALAFSVVMTPTLRARQAGGNAK